MLSPQDPAAFRAKVLRRAVQLERRRRRARLLLGVPAVVAVALLGVLVADRRGTPSSLASGDAPGVLTVEALDVPASGRPWSVVAAADGTMWVLTRDGRSSSVTAIRARGRATYRLPPGAEPDALVAGTDQAVWATSPATSEVLRITADGTVTRHATDTPPSASSTWLGGRLWFAEARRDRITGLDPSGGTVHHPLPRGRSPRVVAGGPDGAVWYASGTSARIGSVSLSGAVNELDLDPEERAIAMTSGPGPALWLVIDAAEGARLARVDAQARVVGDPVGADDPPQTISIGPDGRIWFATGDGSLQRRSAVRHLERELGQPLRVDAWALAADETMWAVDRGRSRLVRITAD